MDISNDVLLHEILLYLDIKDLSHLCQVNKDINKLCLDEYLWEHKVINEYPDYYDNKPIDMSWYNYYLNLVTEYQTDIYIYSNNVYEYIGNIFMNIFIQDINIIIQKVVGMVIKLFKFDFGQYIIVFTDDDNQPVGIVTHITNRQLDYLKLNNNQISKIFISTNPDIYNKYTHHLKQNNINIEQFKNTIYKDLINI